MLTAPNDSVYFPRRRPDASFCVEVTLEAHTNDENFARKIEQWLTDVWVPSNATWHRSWKTGPDLSVERIELLQYFDEFLSAPTITSSGAAGIRLQLNGRDTKRKSWKDWLVLRILPDLKATFPQVGDILGITDCA